MERRTVIRSALRHGVEDRADRADSTQHHQSDDAAVLVHERRWELSVLATGSGNEGRHRNRSASLCSRFAAGMAGHPVERVFLFTVAKIPARDNVV